MAVDLTSLRNATERLDFALTRRAREPDDEEVRDSVIQRFEFTYDLSHKMLRRVLEATSANVEEIKEMSFPSLIRTAWEQGLIASDWPTWHEFRNLRNKTSHTYDLEMAIEVAGKVAGFLQEAQFLVSRLDERLSE